MTNKISRCLNKHAQSYASGSVPEIQMPRRNPGVSDNLRFTWLSTNASTPRIMAPSSGSLGLIVASAIETARRYSDKASSCLPYFREGEKRCGHHVVQLPVKKSKAHETRTHGEKKGEVRERCLFCSCARIRDLQVQEHNLECI